MPYLPDTTIRLPVGGTNLAFFGPTVVKDDPRRINVLYDYSWLTDTNPRSATGALPGTLAIDTAYSNGRGALVNRLHGNAPATAGIHTAICKAEVSANQFDTAVTDPDSPYEATVTFITGNPPPDIGTADALFNRIQWNDDARIRRGMPHDDPNELYLFMELAAGATNLDGIAITQGTVTRYWLPIENIQQFIAPRITSRQVPTELIDAPYETGDPANGQVPTLALGQNRSRVIYGPATLRVLWNENFLSHSGPYGLYQASLNMGLSVGWIYYQRKPADHIDRNGRRIAGTTGRIIRSWTGYVGQFDDNLTRQGRIVTCTIYPDAAAESPTGGARRQNEGGAPSLASISLRTG